MSCFTIHIAVEDKSSKVKAKAQSLAVTKARSGHLTVSAKGYPISAKCVGEKSPEVKGKACIPSVVLAATVPPTAKAMSTTAKVVATGGKQPTAIAKMDAEQKRFWDRFSAAKHKFKVLLPSTSAKYKALPIMIGEICPIPYADFLSGWVNDRGWVNDSMWKN